MKAYLFTEYYNLTFSHDEFNSFCKKYQYNEDEEDSTDLYLAFAKSPYLLNYFATGEKDEDYVQAILSAVVVTFNTHPPVSACDVVHELTGATAMYKDTKFIKILE